MKIAILGPPGSGKGSQVELIERDFDLEVISMGTILRRISKKNTKLGKVIDKLMDKGKLVPSNLVNKIILKRLRRKDVLFDGYPREIIEAKFLDSKINLDYVFLLKSPEKILINRLKNRRVCSCGMTYNLLTKKPKKNLKCDNCGRELVIRDDDYPKAIKKRIQIYRKKTLPMINYYRRKGILIEINGNRPLRQTYKDIKNYLRNV